MAHKLWATTVKVILRSFALKRFQDALFPVLMKLRISIRDLVMQFYKYLISKGTRPKMHYLCGTDIENLTILNQTTEFHNIGSICKVQNDQNDPKNLQVYTPKNTQEIVKILQKYSNGFLTTV